MQQKKKNGPVIYPTTTQLTRLQTLGTLLDQRLPTCAKSKALASGVYLSKASQGRNARHPHLSSRHTPPKLEARQRSMVTVKSLPFAGSPVQLQAGLCDSNRRIQVHSRRDLGHEAELEKFKLTAIQLSVVRRYVYRYRLSRHLTGGRPEDR